MSLDVNNVFVTLDEDLIAVNDPDEVVAFTATYNASLSSAFSAITGASPTADFTTTQIAAQDNFFTLSGNVTDLKLVKNSDGEAFPVGGTSGVDSGLKTADGTSIYLFQSSSTNNIIYGAIGNDATNPAAFVIVVDEQVTGGVVTNAKLWVVQYAALKQDGAGGDNTDFVNLLNKVFIASTALNTAVFSDFSDVPAGSPVFAMIADDTNQNAVDFLVTSYNADNPGTPANESLTPITVNISNQGSFPGSLASGSQNLTPGTGLRFDTVLNGNNAYTQSQGQSDTNIAFTGHAPVVQAGFTVVQNQGNRPTDLNIQALNSNAPNDAGHSFMTSLGNQTAVGVDRVKVTVIDGTGAVVQTITDTTATNAFVTFNGDGSVTVKNALLNWTIEIFQDATFNRFTVTNVDSQQNAYVDIGRLTFTSTSTAVETDEIGSHIQVEDSLPDVTAQTPTADTLSVDDDALNTGVTANFSSAFTTAFGSDGPAASGSTVYSLTAAAGASGLVDTATNASVLLKVVSGVVHGYVTIAAVDTDVFTVSVNASTGQVTLTQQRAVKQADTGTTTDASQDPTNLVGTNLIGLVATVTDKDGDTDTATADITQTLEFKDSQPSLTTPADLDLKFASGQTDSESFTLVQGADGASVEIGSFNNVTSSLYRAVPSDPTGGTHVDFYDTKGTASTADDTLSFHMDVTNAGYTVTVDALPTPEEVPLDFASIASGGPKETLSVPLLGGGDSIIFDGFINGQQDPGDNDFLNPDNVGFGVKGGQASQINPGESFSFETASGVDLSSLSFDIAGIGNLSQVTVQWKLYDDNGTPGTSGPATADDILIDSGLMVRILPKGNNTIHQQIIDDGATTTLSGFTPGAGHTQGGESFDYGVVSFVFPGASTNQGIRVLDFKAGVPGDIPPAEFEFTLVAEDGDGDQAFSDLITVRVDPTFA